MLQTGTQAIADAATTAVVTFATVFTSTPTVIIPVVVNTSGDGGILTPAMTVTVKTTTGFTVLFSEAIDSENYQLMWLAGDAAGAIELMGGKKLTSYQNIDSLLNHQFKIPCLDLEGQPGMKLISEETFWSAVLQRAAQIPASPLAGLTGNLTVTADANWLYIETSDRWARIPLDASASWSTQPFYVPFREAEVALDDNTGDQVVTLTFATPFPTGELPKVMVTLLDTTSTEVAPMAFQVTDITLEGFSITLAAPLQSDNVAVYYMARQLNSFYELSADLVDEDETTSQPTHLFAQLGGLVKRLTWAGFRALLDPVYAKLASPALTGTPTTPTASAGTGTTQIASTAFVQAAVAAKMPLRQTITAPVVFVSAAESAEQTAADWPGISVVTGDTLTFKLFARISFGSGASGVNAGILFPPALGGVECQISGTDFRMYVFSESMSVGTQWGSLGNANPLWPNPGMATGVTTVYEGKATFSSGGTFKPFLFADNTLDPGDTITLEKGSYFEFEKT